MNKILLVVLLSFIWINTQAQSISPPVDSTDHYHLYQWNQGARPGADALNRNSDIIDNSIWVNATAINSMLIGASEYALTGNTIPIDSGAIFTKTTSTPLSLVFSGIVQKKAINVILTNTNGAAQGITWTPPPGYTLFWEDGIIPSTISANAYDVYTFVIHSNKISGSVRENYTSELTAPNAPVLVAPITNATGVSITPLLNWDNVVGATSYNVQVSTSIGFGSPIVNQTGLGASQYTVSPSLSISTKYYWRASATNTEGTSPYSVIDSFTTATPSAPNIVYTVKPLNFQLFTRDAQDSATITVAGQLQTSGYDSIYIELYKAGALVSRSAQFLSYFGSDANFSLSRKIHAELAEYKVILYTKYAATSVGALTVDSMVCGDAYVIMGQSNAQAPTVDITYTSQYARVFGIQTNDQNSTDYNSADTSWHQSTCNYSSYDPFSSTADNPYNVGAWGMQLQRHLIDSAGIPSVVINGALHSTSIVKHLKNISNPTDFSTLYGKVLYRVQKSRVETIKSVFWYQGEIDVDGASLPNIGGYATYASNFASLRAAWYADFPNLSKVFVMQIRPLGCATSAFAQELRETQRQLGITYSDVQVIPTVGLPGYSASAPSSNCHYTSAGYIQLANYLYQRLKPLYYYPLTSDTVNLQAPSVKKAFFKGSAKTKIAVVFNGSAPVGRPSDSLGFAIENYFYLNKVPGFTSGVISSMAMSNDTMYLNLTGSTTATRLGCYPNRYDQTGSAVYNAPWIRNSRGLGMLSFDNVVIMEPESDSLFQIMPTATLARQYEMDTLIKRMKYYNVFNGDALYIYANSDTGMANINWLTGRRDSFRCIINGGVTFTPEKGYTSDGTSGYLNTQYRPSISGTSFTLNSGNVAVYCYNNIISNGLDMRPFGVHTDGSNSFLGIVPRDYLFAVGSNTKFFTNVNDATTLIGGAAITNLTGQGLFLANRTSSSLVTAYRNGATFGYTNPAQTSGALASNPIFVLAYNEAVGAVNSPFWYYPGRVAMFRIGGSWDATQISDFYTNCIEWWMLRRGASWTQ